MSFPMILSFLSAASAGTWGPNASLYGPFAVSSPPEPPVVAVNSAGHSLTAWDATGLIRYSYRLSGANWTADQGVPGAQGMYVAAALGSDGTAAIAWVTVATEFTPSYVMVSVAAPGHQFPAGTAVTDTGGADLQLGIAGDGSALLVWSDPTGVWSSSLDANGWSAPTLLSAPGAPGFRADVDVNDEGDAVVAWDRGVPGVGSEVVATFRAAGAAAFETPQTVSVGASAWGADAAIDADGDAVVGYIDDTTMTLNARAVGGAWGAPLAVSPPVQLATWPAIAMDDQGDLVVAWQTRDPVTNATAIWARRAVAGAPWTSSMMVSTRAEAPGWPTVAYSGDGLRAAIAWVDDNATRVRTVLADETPAGLTWLRSSQPSVTWGSWVPVDAGGGAVSVVWADQNPANPNSAMLHARTND